MSRYEIDPQALDPICQRCNVYNQGQQFMKVECVPHNRKFHLIYRLEPCETILENSFQEGVGDFSCKLSLQESANRNKN